MRLKTFTAPTMSEAMHMVREALGEDAVIVSSYHGRAGSAVQITAALEDDVPVGDELAKVLEDEEREAMGAEPIAPEPEGVISQVLAYHGVPQKLANTLSRIALGVNTNDPVMALAAALDAHFTWAPLPSKPQQAQMLVGPPGSGKTVTAAKVAARFVLKRQPVHLVTTDTVRAGAVDQLKVYSDRLNAPLDICEKPADLKLLLNGLQRQNDPAVRIIDSPGTNPFSTDEVKDLFGFIKACNVSPILVIHAGMDAFDSADVAHIYSQLGVRRMVVTQLDVARRFGGILAAAEAGKLAIGHASFTPFVANGLTQMNPVSLARLLFRDPNEEGIPVDMKKAAT